MKCWQPSSSYCRGRTSVVTGRPIIDLQQMQHAQRIDLDGITALVAITRIQ